MTNKEIIENQKIVIAAREQEIKVLKYRLEFLEKCVKENVRIEIHEIHTFAKPDDVSDLDFPGVSSEDK